MPLLLALILLLAFAVPASAETLDTTQVFRAGDFRNSIGVNVHADYGGVDHQYQNFSTTYGAPAGTPASQTWKQKVCESGVKVLRTGLKPVGFGPTSFGVYQVNQLYADCGVRWVLTVGDPDAYLSTLQNLGSYTRGAILAIEGGNELDNSYWGRVHQSVAQWAAAVRASVQGTHDWLDAHGYADVPVIAPSFIRNAPWDPAQPGADKAGDLSAWVDYGNAHPYPGGQLPEDATTSGLSTAAVNSPGKLAWFTETGYWTPAPGGSYAKPPHPGVPEDVQAIYLLRAWANDMRRGVVGTASYQLLDDLPADPNNGETHFGLVRRDWTDKPSEAALTRMLSYLDSGTAYSPVAQEIKVTSPSGVIVRALPLQRADGCMVLLLWRPTSIWNTSTATPITTVAASVDVSVYRPDWPYGMYADKERPTVPGSYTPSGPAAANVGGWRTWTGFSLDDRPLLLRVWY